MCREKDKPDQGGWPRDYRPSMRGRHGLWMALVIVTALTCSGPSDDGQPAELREAYKRKNKALDQYLKEERRSSGHRNNWRFMAALALGAMRRLQAA